MLWPEGSASIAASLGSYLDPQLPDEHVVSFSVSKAGSYVAIASRRVLALFRLKPFSPLSIYPALFPETEIIEVVTSARGSSVVVATRDNRITAFRVEPHADIEEALRIGLAVTPGPGEAIGARELWLRPTRAIHTEHDVRALGAHGRHLIIYTSHHVQIVNWDAFDSEDPLKPPVPDIFSVLENEESGEILAATEGALPGKDAWLSCIVTTTGKAIVLFFNGEEKTAQIELAVTNACTVDYNVRMSKLAVATTSGKIIVVEDFVAYAQKPPSYMELHTDTVRNPRSIQWTPAGTVLFVGYADGWQLVSMLGLVLYQCREKPTDESGPNGVVQAAWMVSAETLLLLGSNGELRLQNMLRWSGPSGADRSRPVLHGNGRLMLYHDPTVRNLWASSSLSGLNSGAQSWLTIPLPSWYMAQNCPLTHVCSSSDGRYVAVAGTVGIMIFSVTMRQWKEIGNRDDMVRGGLCWHGRNLIAAAYSPDDHSMTLTMYSAVAGSKSRHSPRSSRQITAGQAQAAVNATPAARGDRPKTSTQDLLSVDGGSSANGLSRSPPSGPVPGSSAAPLLPSAAGSTTSLAGLGHGSLSSEQQVVAKDKLGSGPSSVVTLMSRGPGSLLAVLAGDSARLLIYDLSHSEFDLIRDMPLGSVLSGGQGHPPVIRSLVLVDEQQVLVLVGTSLLLVSVVEEDSRKFQRQVVAEPIESFTYVPQERQLWVFDGREFVVTAWPAEASQKYVASIPLDAFPVHVSTHRGVLSLIEAEPVRSFDGSFVVARPSTSQEVYLPYVLEAALSPSFGTAVDLARKYKMAPYFAGVLETVLYRAVTSDEDAAAETKLAIELIRSFPEQNLDAIVARCARKVEMKYWPRLFDAVGESPADLFDECLSNGDLETANEYLLVVHASSKQGTPEPGVAAEVNELELDGRMLSLYKAAFAAKQFYICRQQCKFLMSLDPSGDALRKFRILTTGGDPGIDIARASGHPTPAG